MLLRILHRTRYRYQSPIDMAQHMLHLQPRDTACQQLLSHELRLDPEPAARSDAVDVFGNARTFFSLQSSHTRLTVEADSLVQTQAPQRLPEGPPWRGMGWERVREHFRYRAQAPFDAASEFLFASPYVPRDDRFAEFARPSFQPGAPMLLAVRDLMERIHGEFTYEADSTEVNTPALRALAQRKGVCQDFAHIMIASLRSLGLPARYVSGYLLTRPPPGKPRLIGADASHAWVSVYVPAPAEDSASPGAWFDFDPTNNRCGWGSPGEDYVTLATGRDFGDVSPMRGVIQGGTHHQLTVEVTVAPPDEFAGLMAPEPA
ncbi:transglutaminase family protein [Hydrogenophaga sp.]|uniref:transglutaminase family protein n=1 Tax=Hydrogenophaga sp. TaxID=1904254 RepID=UPI0026224960|nr:transglutaminase family protein [Hydrogenophaga sp.]MCW5653693.1 transglutaminase family protein [Hydrogenophaga sp.]